MKANYISPEGIIKFIAECPEEPDQNDFIRDTMSYNIAYDEYTEALATAKESAVPYADQEQATSVINKLYFPNGKQFLNLAKDTLHPIPDNYRVEVRLNCEYLHPRELAYLLPTKQHQKNLLIDMMKADEESGMYEEPVPLNFWKRLEMFVENVQVNDSMSEEEKQMIIRVASERQIEQPSSRGQENGTAGHGMKYCKCVGCMKDESKCDACLQSRITELENKLADMTEVKNELMDDQQPLYDNYQKMMDKVSELEKENTALKAKLEGGR